jgi:hypothetical protein
MCGYCSYSDRKIDRKEQTRKGKAERERKKRKKIE